MSALGAFSQGLGDQLIAGKARNDRAAQQALSSRALDIEEQRIAAGAYDQPQFDRSGG